MSLERMRPYIIRRLKLMYKTSFESLKKESTIEELRQLVNGDKEILETFIPVLEPNTYMENLYVFLSQKGAGSIAHMVTWYKKRQRSKKKKLADDTIRRAFDDEVKYLEILELITKEVLYYTWPAPTAIWIARWANDEQIQDAIKKYPYKEGFEKRRSKDYNHNKASNDSKGSNKRTEEVVKPTTPKEPETMNYYCTNWKSLKCGSHDLDNKEKPRIWNNAQYKRFNGVCTYCGLLLTPVVE